MASASGDSKAEVLRNYIARDYMTDCQVGQAALRAWYWNPNGKSRGKRHDTSRKQSVDGDSDRVHTVGSLRAARATEADRSSYQQACGGNTRSAIPRDHRHDDRENKDTYGRRSANRRRDPRSSGLHESAG